MTRFIKATYHANIKVAEFIAEDGRHLLRSGGSLPWRINNGGDLASPVEDGKPAPKKTRNYIGFAQVPRKSGGDFHFFIFPDYETGRAELCASLRRKHRDRSIPEVVEKYAPSEDNNTRKYITDLLALTGIPATKKVKDFSDSELSAMADGIERLEGYHQNPETRREVWVPVSTIVASDGARPLAEEEIVLKVGSDETVLTSNQVGQFPPIPMTGKPIEVRHRTVNGQSRKVGELTGHDSEHFNLVTQVLRVFGMTKPDKAPEGSRKTRRQPFDYRVQPNDSLSKIAAKFKTTVDDLKVDNCLTSDKIFPGQVIRINGVSTSEKGCVEKAKPKKAPSKVAGGSISPESKRKPAPATEISVVQVRSDVGLGAPLGLITPDSHPVPWMTYAVAEARRFKGLPESEIAKIRNYHVDIGSGRQSIVGDANAWCAAFVNWCLMYAGYAIENPGFFDRNGAKGRASAFYHVAGPKAENKGQPPKIIRNPLFVKIKEPIFGAIAVLSSRGGEGRHTGFVYARENDTRIVLLGGNQSQQINFTAYYEDTKRECLSYFVPAAYYPRVESAMDSTGLDVKSAIKLNAEFGIATSGQKAGEIR